MDCYTLVSLLLVLVEVKMILVQQAARKRRRVVRRYWVHPIISPRLRKGHFHTLYHDLRKYPPKFFDYTRMRVSTFDALLEIVRPRLMRSTTRFRKLVSAEERLMVTLRFLATGESFASLHYQFLLGKATIHFIVHDTCAAIWRLLQPSVMPQPTEEHWLQISKEFDMNSNFPHCIGALDGKRIRVQMPPHSGSKFYHYKKYFSFVLMAIADSNYNFVAIDVGAYGSSNDSQVYRNSPMGRKMIEGRFNIPGARPLTENGEPFPYVLVADEAFALSTTLMKPFPERGLDLRKKVFNYRLTRARRFVECTFGIMANKWRIFSGSIQLHPKNVDTVIKCVCALHNFVRQREGYNFEDSLSHEMEEVTWIPGRGPQEAWNYREQLANHFMSPEGELPWQYSKV